MAPSSTIFSPARPQPAWDIARLFPDQGQWGTGDYLSLNRQTNQLVELADGVVEVLPVAGKSHQRLVLALRDALKTYADANNAGESIVAPYPVKVAAQKFRQPDVVFATTAHAGWLGEDYAESADLVMEVVSEDRARDLVTKRREYADAGISEYWIIDPKDRRVTVLRLIAGGYETHSEAAVTGRVESALLPDFSIETAQLWA